jgi:tellurite resistance protein
MDRNNVPYKNGSLTVTLAAIVALADGHASDSELVAIDQMILTWTHLSLDLRTRLQAQYRLQVRQPATLASLKSKLAGLGAQDRLQVASVLSSLATVDGVVSPEEVKLLEQVYRILELDPQALYSRLHGGVQKEWKSADALTSFPGANNSAPLLDKVRITELRQETDRVMKLLTPVFADDDPDAPSEHSGIESRETVTTETDVDYCVLPELSLSDRAFLTLLLGKSEWSRAELLRAATEMQIMLDGTLERINEAALDHFGDALVEGDDPICVQQAILETTE